MRSRKSKKLTSTDFRLISELIKNSRLSDRQIARKTGFSQPTVTRRRGELEKQELLDYTSIPDLAKLGYGILAVTFARWQTELLGDQRIEAARDFMRRHPNMLFVSTGRGLGYDRVVVSVHKSYSDYSVFMSDLRSEWQRFLGEPDSFLISLESDNVLRKFTLKYLAEQMEKEHAE